MVNHLKREASLWRTLLRLFIPPPFLPLKRDNKSRIDCCPCFEINLCWWLWVFHRNHAFSWINEICCLIFTTTRNKGASQRRSYAREQADHMITQWGQPCWLVILFATRCSTEGEVTVMLANCLQGYKNWAIVQRAPPLHLWQWWWYHHSDKPFRPLSAVHVA